MKLEAVIIKQSMEAYEEGVFIMPSNKECVHYINECIAKGYITQIIQNEKNFNNTNIVTFNVFFNKKYGKNKTLLKYKEFEYESETFDFSPIYNEFRKQNEIINKQKEGEKILSGYTKEEIEYLEKNCTGMIERTKKGEMNLLDMRNNIHMLIRKLSVGNNFIKY